MVDGEGGYIQCLANILHYNIALFSSLAYVDLTASDSISLSTS